MGKRLIFAGLLLIIIVSTWLAIKHNTSSHLVLHGVVETNIYAHYCEVSGKITELPIELGQVVKAGDVLAVLDDSNERYALKQLEETLAKKQAILVELTSGVDPEELEQCRNNISTAAIEYENAQLSRNRTKEDYERVRTLADAGAISQSELDKIKYQSELAEAAVATTAFRLDNARQQLALLQKGTPQEKIDAAQADVALTRVQISQTKDNLEKYKITAVHDGTIISKNYLLGNLVSGGYDLFDIASGTEKHLVTYVPKEHLSRISYGQKVLIRGEKEEYEGKISFIDIKAQYTPREMQSSANKNKESMKIKISLTCETPLKVGEKAEIMIP